MLRNENKQIRASFLNEINTNSTNVMHAQHDISGNIGYGYNKKYPRVIVAIDWENIFLSLKKNPKLKLNRKTMDILDDYLHDNFDVIVKKAYLNSASSNRSKKILDSYRYTVIDVPSRIHNKETSTVKKIKNAVDGKLTIDVFDDITTIPSLDSLILLSGDGDFIPLIKHIKKRGINVILISIKNNLSKNLSRLCTKVIYLENLIIKSRSSKMIENNNEVQQEINEKLKKYVKNSEKCQYPLPSALNIIYEYLEINNLQDLGAEKSTDLKEKYPTMFNGLRIENNSLLLNKRENRSLSSKGRSPVC